VGGGYLVTVGGLQNTAVGGARLEQVAGSKTVIVAGSQEESVGRGATVEVAGDSTIHVLETLASDTAGDSKADLSAAAGLEVTGPAAWVAKSIQLEADELKIMVGGDLLLQVKKSGQVTFASANFTVDGSQITAKGSKIEESGGEGPSSGSATVAEAKKLEAGDKTVVVTFKSGAKAACVGLAYELTLPDGSKKSGEVTASGLSLGGVKAGSSKLAFTGLDEGSG
jgi:hypothetical protein